jgi:hypothetical protein
MLAEETANRIAYPIGRVIPACLLGGAIVFFIAYLVGGGEGDLQSATALAITAAPFAVAAREAPERLLHPLALFGFTMLLGVAGQTIFLTQGSPAVLPELLSGMSPQILTHGLTVVGIGTFCLLAGYLLANPGDSVKPGAVFSWGVSHRLGAPVERRVLWVCMAILAIAALTFAVYAPKVGIHSLGQLLSSHKRFVREPDGTVRVFGYYRFLIELSGIGFIATVYTITKRRLSWRSPLGAVGVLSFLFFAAFAVIVSSRTELFATLATAAFVYLALRGKEPRFRVMAALLVAALAAAAILLVLRSSDNPEAADAGQGRVDKTLDDVLGSRDWMSIGPIAVVTERVPGAYPFQYGKTLISLFVEPVPRSLWPGKPSVRIGQAIAEPVYGFPGQKRISGDPPGIVGELWIDGGTVGVIIGMAVLGVAIRWVERWYSMSSATDGLSALVFGITVVAFCLQLPIADFTGVITTAIETFVSLLIVLWIARRPARTVEDPAPQATPTAVA